LAQDSLLADEDGILLLVGLLGLKNKSKSVKNCSQNKEEEIGTYLVSFSKFRHFARLMICVKSSPAINCRVSTITATGIKNGSAHFVDEVCDSL
jgi:hypothetical protein